MDDTDKDAFEPIGAICERLLRTYFQRTLPGLPVVEAPSLAGDGHELARGFPARLPRKPVLNRTQRQSREGCDSSRNSARAASSL